MDEYVGSTWRKLQQLTITAAPFHLMGFKQLEHWKKEQLYLTYTWRKTSKNETKKEIQGYIEEQKF